MSHSAIGCFLHDAYKHTNIFQYVSCSTEHKEQYHAKIQKIVTPQVITPQVERKKDPGGQSHKSDHTSPAFHHEPDGT